MLSPKLLRPYQQDGADAIYENDSMFVTCPMGAGKTVITLTAIADLLKDTVVNRVLIVAPLRVAQLVWKQEAAKWAHLSHLDIELATGNPSQRHKAVCSGSEIVVMNYENLTWLADNYKKHIPFTMIVFDETTRLKSPKSKRWKALKKILPEFRIKTGLTGTPTTQGLMDLFGQVYCLDTGKALGTSFNKFKQDWFYCTDRNGWNWLPRENALEDIISKIRDMTFNIEPGDYTKQLPELIINKVPVTLPADARKHYKEMREELLLQLENTDITAATAAVATAKLQQIADGFVYETKFVNEDEVQTTHWLHDAKLDALSEILASRQGAPTLVAYRYKAELTAMLAKHPGPYLGAGVSGAEANKIVEAWNNKELPILYVHPASAGHGLNLQYGGDTIVWYGMTWSLEEWQQTIARLHRGGQEFKVWAHAIVANNTVDTRIMNVLEGKKNIQESVMEELKNSE